MPFQKGHNFGARFQKGHSGNPGGRPKSKTLSEAMRLELSKIGDKKTGQTNAELICQAMIKKALNGDLKAAVFVRDTAEGRPAQKVQLAESLQAKEQERQVRFLANTFRITQQKLGDDVSLESVWTVIEETERSIFGEDVSGLKEAVLGAVRERKPLGA